MNPLLLELYCGAGGAAKGFHDSGFTVIGVDINPQPNYPYEFHQADALDVLRTLLSGATWQGYRLADFAAAHASPPCQLFTPLGAVHGDGYAARHVDLIAPTRELLQATGLPWTMENVPQAPLLNPITLCGSMFDLPVKRHRDFESSFTLYAPSCRHERWRELWPEGLEVSVSKARLASGSRQPRSPVVGVYGHGGGPGKDLDTWRWAMGTPWMQTKHEVAESIPPAFAYYIGRQLRAQC